MTEKLSEIEILNWFIDAGIDVTVAEEPVDLTEYKEEKVKVAPIITQTNQAPQNNSEVVVERRKTPSLDGETIKSIEIARDIAEKSNSIEELNKKILEFEGCSLKFTASNTILGFGNKDAKYMIIGEAPGADDDRSGQIYSGKAGKLLDGILKSIDLSRENSYLCNILPWRPPGNRTPNASEVNICMPFILKQIELVDPEYIILLGGNAANYILENNEPISKIRGKWLELKIKEKVIKSVVIFQPSYLLKNPKQKRKTWIDLIRIKKNM